MLWYDCFLLFLYYTIQMLVCKNIITFLLSTAIFTHTVQGKNLQAISATQLLKMDTRTTEILSFKKICGAVFEIDRFKVFPLVNFTRKKG